jgi:hypothetical protein
VFNRRRGEKVVPPTKMRLLGKEDLSYIREIDSLFPVEISPVRSLEFQNAGLPYRTYTLEDKGDGSTVCVREYFPSTWVIHYVHQPNRIGIPSLIKLLDSIASGLQNENKRLIWRVKAQDQDRFEELLSKSSFELVAEENHYHYQGGN